MYSRFFHTSSWCLNHRPTRDVRTDLGLTQDRLHAAQSELIRRGARADETERQVTTLRNEARLNRSDMERFWILLAAVLVFFMQAGFMCLDTRMGRKQGGVDSALLLLSALVFCIVFYFVGFDLMFGFPIRQPPASNERYAAPANADTVRNHLEFFLFQLGFGITAASILSGALRDKIALLPYCAVIVAFGAGIYPLFGHLAWADSGWLNTGWTIWGRRYAFNDFAGSTVVHSVAAWVVLSGNQILGVSPDQWRLRGTQELQASGLSYRLLGVMLIWFGAWGFNAGTAVLDRGRAPRLLLRVLPTRRVKIRDPIIVSTSP